jgi:hypothetical protein
MNNDGLVDEADLFSLLKCQQENRKSDENQRDRIFMDVLYADMMDVHSVLRGTHELSQNPVYEMTASGEDKIKDIRSFIGLRKIKRENVNSLAPLVLQHISEAQVIDNSYRITNIIADANEEEAKAYRKRQKKRDEFLPEGLTPGQLKVLGKVSNQIDKMTTEGEGCKLNERRNSLGFYVQQTGKLYGTKEFTAKLNQDEF